MAKISEIKLSELAVIERAVGGKIYPAGTILTKLSAADDAVLLLRSPSPVSPQFAAIQGRNGINAEYLYLAILNVYPEYFAGHRQGMNFLFEDVGKMIVKFNFDLRAQLEAVEFNRRIDARIANVREEIEGIKHLKEFLLCGMFPHQ